ncbi:peptidase M13 [Williamsia sp. CHRR-6]|nr:peptidase M13 [Williamsia sp. CHRR-6]
MTNDRDSGLELHWVDPDIRPQDDFYGHVNGTWLRETTIAADEFMASPGVVSEKRKEGQLAAILDDAASDPAAQGDRRRIADLYTSYTDVERVNALGLEPLRTVVERIQATTDRTELCSVLGDLTRTLNTPTGPLIWLNQDERDSSRYLVHLLQSGLSLPDESYYRTDTHADLRHAFAAHVCASLALLELPDADTAGARVLAVESAIAAHHWEPARTRDLDQTYNLLNWAELRSIAGGFDIGAWIAGLQAPAGAFDEVVVNEPSALAGLGKVFTQTALADLQTWAIWHAFHSAASWLGDDIADHDFTMNRLVYGTQQRAPLPRRACSAVTRLLGDALGRLYVQRHFPPHSKDRIDTLVANLMAAYRCSIAAADWLTESTRVQALSKLAAFRPQVGYPQKWMDYSGLQLDPNDLFGNVQRCRAFEMHRQLSKVGQSVDRDIWIMPAHEANAYYEPGMNEIVFPAGFLQFPMFDADADDALNYGAIGAVIGHEIGHGFDDQGAKFDGDGNLRNWWTDADRAAFAAKTAVLIEQFDTFTPRDLDEGTVNGAQTVGENIADLGGLSIALKAYAIATEETGAPVIDGLTGAQRVFYSWAQNWRMKLHPETTQMVLAMDVHSPAEFRVNGIVPHIPEFYAEFDVQPGDAMYLPPDKRVRLW